MPDLFLRTYTFVDGTTAYGSQVEAEIGNIVDTLNDLDTATVNWGRVSVLHATSVPLIADCSSGSQNIAEFKNNNVTKASVSSAGLITAVGASMSAGIDMNSNKITELAAATTNGDAIRYEQLFGTLTSYRRPVLTYVSATTVDVENNTGTANETKIIFPDGNIRSVTEDTSSTTKYRRFDITADAEFTSGTEDSGLRAALSEATNTWYAIYAVKSAIDSTKFVLVGDTVLPLQANFSTLNTSYGTNGWIYLGMIRNGDNSGTTGDILSFVMDGNNTYFNNVAVGVCDNFAGVLLATTAGATSLTYTYASGTGAAQIPAHLTVVTYQVAVNPGSTISLMDNSAATRRWMQSIGTVRVFMRAEVPAADGCRTSNGSSVGMDILISGFVDSALFGLNPLI